MFPTAEHPFYHVKTSIILNSTSNSQIRRVNISGKQAIDYFTCSKGRPLEEPTLKGGVKSEVIIRYDWKCGEDIEADILVETDEKKKPLSIKARTRAPAYGGYWDPSWKYYAGVVCSETAGIDRINEPVHVTFAFYSDRITDPERELRIVAIDPLTGLAREVPSQVHSVSRYECEKPDEGYQPTTIFEAAFHADMPANSSRVFLAFYGNPNSPSPLYPSGLKISGTDPGLTVENEFYSARLAKTSGALDELEIKMGANRTLAHHLETNGAFHWNPDVYAPPRPWLHTSDWNPPAICDKTSGPVFVMTQRSGPLDHYPEVEASVTYIFYAHVPWILMSSTIEVKKDISVKALRNGEIVLNREIVDEFAWHEPGGGFGSMMIEEGPRHPKHAKVLPFKTPWACFFSRIHGCGLGMLTIELAGFKRDGGFARTYQPYSYLQWGPWTYYARPIVYTFISNNPGRFVTVPGGNIYYEKMALVPLRIDDAEKSFDYLEKLQHQLSNPLIIKVVEDTDPRAPAGWLPPILVEEFEEMEDR